MAYDGRILRRAQAQFEEERTRREESFRRKREAVYARRPRLKEIDGELRATMSRIISSALRNGTDPRPAMNVLRDKNLSLQEERTALLAELGLPADYLEEKPLCPLCNDRGFRGEAVCRCLREYYAREQKKELSRMLDLGNQRFETFSPEWYPETLNSKLGTSTRQHMEGIRDGCVDYAYGFNGKNGNMLFSGPPGLGKTFLSACIAAEVTDKGCSVVYESAPKLFTQLEKARFAHDPELRAQMENYCSRYTECDLLILDDLGTELSSQFVTAALYQLINERYMLGKATIISTNLKNEDMESRYSSQVVSRLRGNYRRVAFVGDDIRLKKNRGQV